MFSERRSDEAAIRELLERQVAGWGGYLRPRRTPRIAGSPKSCSASSLRDKCAAMRVDALRPASGCSRGAVSVERSAVT